MSAQSADTIIQHAHNCFHFEYCWALRLCDPHTLLEEYIDCVSPARPSITMVESTAENCVFSVLFLLDDAGLNKGPPTNTNTGSGSSHTHSIFCLFGQPKTQNTFQIRRFIWQRIHRPEQLRGCGDLHFTVTDRHCWCVFQMLACQFNQTLLSVSKSTQQQHSYSFDLWQRYHNSYRIYIAYGDQSIPVDMDTKAQDRNLREGNVYTAQNKWGTLKNENFCFFAKIPLDKQEKYCVI